MSYKLDIQDGTIVGLSQVSPESELQHHKYVKRYLSKKGYWVYVYPDKKSSGKKPKASQDKNGQKRTLYGDPSDRTKPLKKPVRGEVNPMRTGTSAPKGITEKIRGKALKRETDLQKYIEQQNRLMKRIRRLMQLGYKPRGPIDTLEIQRVRRPVVRGRVSRMRT